MASDRTKLLRGVLIFLAGCAVLGFVMGLRGALPAGDIGYGDEASPVSSGVVVEASPVQDIPPPTVQEQPQAKEEAAEEPAEPEAPAAEPEPEPKPEPKPAPKPAPPPKPAPKEEPPPADPVGDLIQGPAVLNNLY